MQRFWSQRNVPNGLFTLTNLYRSEVCCISMINLCIHSISILTHLHNAYVIRYWDKKGIYGKMSKWVMNCYISLVNSKEISFENLTAYQIQCCCIRLITISQLLIMGSSPNIASVHISKYRGQKGLAAIQPAKKSAGVTLEMSLKNPYDTCEKECKRGIHLAFKPGQKEI